MTRWSGISAATVAVAVLAALPVGAEERQPGAQGAEAVQNQYPDDGMNYRERMAVNYMEKRLRKIYPSRAYKVTVSPTLVQYPGNKLRPVTGYRPVEVDARVKMKKAGGNLFARVRHNTSSKSHSRFYVDVRKGALPAVVAQHSMTPLARAGRLIPLGEKLHDVVNSRGVRAGAVEAGLGLALTEISLPAALAAVSYGAVEMYNGVGRRSEARRRAVEKTASWARESIGKGINPSAAEAFSTYKQYLEENKPGTHPGTLKSFLNRLAVHGL